MSQKKIRLYIKDSIKKDKISLNQWQSHYLVNVMRCTKNDFICVFNEKDGEWTASLNFLGKKVSLIVDKHIRKPKISPVKWLAFPILNTQQRLHFLIEKATELGVTHFQPLITDYTQKKNVNYEKLERIATEAVEQCERFDIPIFFQVAPFDKFLKHLPMDISWFVALERSDGLPLKNLENEKIGILIGPEGGFSIKEKEKIEPLLTVNLGNNILRSETAALVMLSCNI
ncbi:MAG: RsmE family RNA methyltransferase [Alphaproteobacteria bacterium]